ncbi:hypothetical protein ACFFG2_18225 [Paraburkholderia solisilvae]
MSRVGSIRVRFRVHVRTGIAKVFVLHPRKMKMQHNQLALCTCRRNARDPIAARRVPERHAPTAHRRMERTRRDASRNKH